MKGILALAVPILVLVGLMLYADKMAPPDQKPYQLSPLAKAGDECQTISEKAAMKLPEALPFQRLEKAGRQARVLADCMNDRGYVENLAWVGFGQLQAAQQAKANKISIDEAYENLRRKYMLIYQAEKAEPIYWVLASKSDKK
jgi:hypothetical protein